MWSEHYRARGAGSRITAKFGVGVSQFSANSSHEARAGERSGRFRWALAGRPRACDTLAIINQCHQSHRVLRKESGTAAPTHAKQVEQATADGKLTHPPPRTSAPGSPSRATRSTPPKWPRTSRDGKWQAARRRVLDGDSVRHGRPTRQDVPHRLERDQRPHDRRKRQGLADYVKATLGTQAPLSCAIAYDTRHRSEHFAELVRRDHGRGRLQGLLSCRATAARRSCRSRCATSSARAASWSRPATIRPATTR